MNSKLTFYSCGLSILLGLTTVFGQSSVSAKPAPPYAVQGSVASAAAPQQGAAVSYASVSEVNDLLAQLEETSRTTQIDLAKLRIERWKADSGSKKEALSKVEAIERNLQGAMPEMIAQLRKSPEDLSATFNLYRDLDTLDSVLGGVVESCGAFGPKDDLQTLSNDLDGFDKNVKAFSGRMEKLAASKEQEILRLRTDLKTAQAAVPITPPKKVVVDDDEPAKKPAVVAKKKPAAKKPAATAPATTAPATTTPSTQSPAKPQ
jgi:hypothetical protein